MGEIAALLTAICWSFNSIQFTLAGRRIGSQIVNRIRLILAALFLPAGHLMVYGSVSPVDAGVAAWVRLGLSGVLGLVIGDGSLFQAFLFVGPRLSMLVQTLVPVFSALLAWLFLGEVLTSVELVAMVVTMTGVAWVVSERRTEVGTGGGSENRKQRVLGFLLAVVAALGQSSGLVIAKPVISQGLPTLSATVIRIFVAAVVIWILTLARRQAGATWRALADRRAVWTVVGGTLVGPVVGIWLSMVAIQRAHVGVASTLMSLTPVMLILPSHWIFHERITIRSVVGTAVALAGAAALVLT